MSRKPKLSLLDYLWVNYGDNPKFTRVERNGNYLIGYDDEGLELFKVEYSGPLSGDSSEVIEFGLENNYYYIKLSNGKKFTAPLESQDLSELRLIVEANNEALLIINGDENTPGSLQLILKLSKDYTDSKIINTDVSNLLLQIDKNSADLRILKGTAEEEGSVLNIVNKSINSAFEWVNLT